MASLKSLASMRAGAKRLADMENAANRFPDSEWNAYLNKGIRHVVAEMITVSDKPFFTSEATITCTPPLVGTSATYSLPANFLRMLSVGWANTGTGASSGPWIPLQPGTEAEYIQLSNANYYGGIGPLKYFITGGPTAFTQSTLETAYSITILPNPTNGSLLRLRYVPQPPELVNDNDTIDGLLGFEDAVETWAAILARRKDELDTTDLERDMAKHFSRIHLIAKRRDGSRPPKISLVRDRSGGSIGKRRIGSGWGIW